MVDRVTAMTNCLKHQIFVTGTRFFCSFFCYFSNVWVFRLITTTVLANTYPVDLSQAIPSDHCFGGSLHFYFLCVKGSLITDISFDHFFIYLQTC